MLLTLNLLESLGLIIGFTVLVTLGLLPIHRSADKFFKLSHTLEEDIRKVDDFEGQYERLRELAKLSFHQRTSQVVRELAKMMEVKYDVEILKR